jgi:outer membrane protein
MVRDQTRAPVLAASGQLAAGKAQVGSAQSQVTASEIDLAGERDEAKAGQRTTRTERVRQVRWHGPKG